MSNTTESSLPATHRALVLNAIGEAPEVKVLPTPQPTPGSAIVQIQCANILNYSHEIYSGKRQYPLATPLVIGASAIGRIAAIGPDAVALKPGQLVLVDTFIRGRDDPTTTILSGVFEGNTDGSRRLMRGEWRNSTYAEFAKVPLENCFALDEAKLLGEFGYGIEQLCDISRLLIPYGGLSSIDLKPAETVIIAPATGSFGSAAVSVALSLGARVVALGRTAAKLEALAKRYSHSLLSTVLLTDDVEKDTVSLKKHAPIHAYFDISPPEAAESTYMTSCLAALSHGGRVSLMGGMGMKGLATPLFGIVARDLVIKGKLMYERKDVVSLIRMVEAGIVKLGEHKVESFGLERWEEAFKVAAECDGVNRTAVFVPNVE